MKRKLIICLAVTIVLLLLSAAQAFAGEYKYRVTVYSGQQGHFSSGKVWSKEYSLGELAEIDLEDLGFTLDNEKYYVRGLRLTGHDNDETSGSQNMTFEVDQDLAYEVAYGIKGQMVEYTVDYVDGNGEQIHDPDTYNGMPGDKPVVAFRYVKGYVPDVYNQSKTLSKEGDNKFTFTYRKVSKDGAAQDPSGSNSGNQGVTGPAAPGTAANPTGTTVASAPGAAGAAAAAGGGAATGNAQGSSPNATIGDDPTALGDNPGQYNDKDDVNGNKTPGHGIPGGTPMMIIGGVIIILLALVLWFFSIKRRE